jgi:hypothetical protein
MIWNQNFWLKLDHSLISLKIAVKLQDVYFKNILLTPSNYYYEIGNYKCLFLKTQACKNQTVKVIRLKNSPSIEKHQFNKCIGLL